MVNLLDLASLLDDVPLRQLSLAPQILKTYNDAVPAIAQLTGDETGGTIQLLYAGLPYVVQQQVTHTSLITTEQLKSIIADITRFRQTAEYLNHRADAAPNAFVYITGTGAIVLALIGFISYAGERAGSDTQTSSVLKGATAILSTLLKPFMPPSPPPK